MDLYSHNLSLPCPMSIIVLIISCWGLWPRRSCLTCVVERTISSTFVYTACRWPIGHGSHKRRTKTRRHTHSSYTHVSIHVFALKTAFPLSFESLSIFFWNLRTGSEDVHATPPTNSSLCFMWGLVDDHNCTVRHTAFHMAKKNSGVKFCLIYFAEMEQALA